MTTKPVVFALNHITSPRLRFADFLRLARELGIDAVEIRNDLRGVEIEDGTPAAAMRRQAEEAGVEILSINALYPFEVWNADLEAKAQQLARYARECGAKALVLCPLNSTDDRRSAAERGQDLRRALQGLTPILQENGVVGLVEPLGFPESALRLKRLAIEAIDEVGGQAVFELVHDTFHHYLADESEIFPERTGLVHISGVEDRSLAKSTTRDAHRVLVGPADLMDNVGQIRALVDSGYRGPFSFEPFAESVHALRDHAGALRRSMDFIRQELAAVG